MENIELKSLSTSFSAFFSLLFSLDQKLDQLNEKLEKSAALSGAVERAAGATGTGVAPGPSGALAAPVAGAAAVSGTGASESRRTAGPGAPVQAAARGLTTEEKKNQGTEMIAPVDNSVGIPTMRDPTEGPKEALEPTGNSKAELSAKQNRPAAISATPDMNDIRHRTQRIASEHEEARTELRNLVHSLGVRRIPDLRGEALGVYAAALARLEKKFGSNAQS